MDELESIGYMRRKKARKTLLVVAVLAVAGFLGYIYLYPSLSSKILSLENSAGKFALQEVKQRFSAPAPLRAPAQTGSTGTTPAGVAAASDALTVKGDILWTNTERKNNGNLPPLNEDSKLDAIAQVRLEDMFKKQYFAHVSPASSSAITVAVDMGYDYLALGENLALGNFGGDEKVVEAWMASPGHRANILNARYTNIGVAARKGNFEGDSVWIAVQVFALPASACPAVDPSLKSEIENEQGQLDAMQLDLGSRRSSIDKMAPGPENRAAVKAYNDEVTQYNVLVADIKAKIGAYNGEVEALNTCLGA